MGIRRMWWFVAAAVTVAPLASASAAGPLDAPIVRDLENQEHATGRWQDQYTSPAFGSKAFTELLSEYPENVANQLEHVDEPILTLGQWIPGGDVGDPFRQDWSSDNRGVRHEIEYHNRDGARISGNLWAPNTGRKGAGPFPGVVITTGSIQAPEEFYWWAAQGLAENGYVVMSYDVQGQGESETFGHRPDGSLWCGQDGCPGVPAQQEANFVEGTEDALDFFLSQDNPLRALVDGDRIGLAGHSLGASAVSKVGNAPTVYSMRAEGSVPNPTSVVVAWDNAASVAVPRVPTMSQTADYFFNPTPNPSGAPTCDASSSALRQFSQAGVDTAQIALRGSTHLEWSYLPLLLPASREGERVAFHYTLAWFDRYLYATDRASDATDRLTASVFDESADSSANIGTGTWDPITQTNVPYTIGGETVVEHLSIYERTAYAFTGGDGQPRRADDVAGLGCGPIPAP